MILRSVRSLLLLIGGSIWIVESATHRRWYARPFNYPIMTDSVGMPATGADFIMAEHVGLSAMTETKVR